MNVFLFASDSKGLSSLKEIANYLNFSEHKFILYASDTTQLKHPFNQSESYKLISNMGKDEFWKSSWGEERPKIRILKRSLPWVPDWVIVARERWEPESSLIDEFKALGSKIALVEPNAQLLNNAETTLETYSRNRFVDKIDVFFDHSEWIKKQRQLVGFNGNSVVVGNPKYPLNFNAYGDYIEGAQEQYNIKDPKDTILLFSLVNSSRPNINKEFKRIVEENPDKTILYKPYPGEPFDPKFSKDYKNGFFLENVTPILEENHIWPLFLSCDTHIGCLSSITHATLILGKKYIDLTKETGMRDRYLETKHIFSNNGQGLENDMNMWMRSFQFSQEEQLKQLLPDNLLEDIRVNNQVVWDTLDNEGDLLTLFDEYNDNESAKRIVNYLENEI